MRSLMESLVTEKNIAAFFGPGALALPSVARCQQDAKMMWGLGLLSRETWHQGLPRHVVVSMLSQVLPPKSEFGVSFSF
jgi:hypothetical protein